MKASHFNKHLLAILLLSLFINSCRDLNEDFYIEPNASFELSKEVISPFEPVTIMFNGQAQRLTLFNGVTDYGVALNPGIDFTTAVWGEPGIYDVVLIATGFNYQDSEVFADTMVKQLTVIDTKGLTLNKLSYRGIANYRLVADTLYGIPQSINIEYYLEVEPDENNNIIIPIYQLSRLQTTSGPVRRASDLVFKPKVYFSRGGAYVNFNGVIDSFSVNFGNITRQINHVDPLNNMGFTPIEYKVAPKAGDETVYKAFVIQIPEFASYTLGMETLKKTLVRVADYQEFDIHFWVNSLEEVNNVKPVFTTRDEANTAVYLIGQDETLIPQVSGESEINFSQAGLNGNVAYRLVYTQPGHPDLKVESTIYVHIHKN